ncbi:MAG TPA: response regulator [Terriglobia bacterium]|nr:response regulator [Terriglobia bacterium]
MMVTSILLIEDNAGDARLIREMLKDAVGDEFAVEWSKTLASGLESLSVRVPDAVILDLNLPDRQGLDTFSSLHRKFPEVPVVVLTGLNDDEGATEAVRAGAQDYLGKGTITGTSLVRVIRHGMERQRAEGALRASEIQYRRLFEAARDGILILNADTGKIVDVNPFMLELLGYTRQEFMGKRLWDIGPFKDKRNSLDSFKVLQENEFIRYDDLPLENKNGKQVEVEFVSNVYMNGKEKVIQCNVRDMTERRHLELQLRQSQKMEAIGQLAGGVAHDFNNLLTVIYGYSQLVIESLDADSPNCKNLKEVSKAVDRAALLTHQLLAFSRRQTLRPQVFNLNDVVADMDKMLQRLIGEDIGLSSILEAKLGRVKADPGQVEQIIMNLAVNARDAMSRGGKVTIETANAELDQTYARDHADVTPGPYVMLAVTDTGSGMNKEVQAHIFEPFFTTKEVGKGTGLGLSTVYGIVKQSGGHIWVYSEPGHGTSFKVYLPQVQEGVSVKHPETIKPTTRGTETILLVEDDESLRQLLCTILEDSGYNVLLAARGEDALLLFEQNKDSIDLILTDIIMPGMSGRELAAHIAAKCPEVKLLFMSGYTDRSVAQHNILDPDTPFLQKPFKAKSVLEKIRQLLDSENDGRVLHSAFISQINTT